MHHITRCLLTDKRIPNPSHDLLIARHPKIGSMNWHRDLLLPRQME